MRKIILPAIILSLLLGTGVFAQGAGFPSPGLTPDSPFYFLERIAEGISTFFTFGDLKKAERYAALASERVAEAEAVVEKGKPEFAEKTLERYERQLNQSIARAERAQAKGQSVKNVMEIVAEGTGKHLTIIESILEKVSEKAKTAAIKAKEASMTGQKNALKALAKEDPEKATEINLKAAEARLNRAKAKAEEGETEEVEEAIEEFENQHKFGEEISQIAQGLGKDITTVEQLVGKATSIHLEILAEVYEKVPEQAKPAIEKAMGVSVRGHEEAVETLKEKGALGEVPEKAPMPERLPEEVKERIHEGIVVGGPCSYDKFKGGCKITSIINESIIKFKFTPTKPIDIEWAKKGIAIEREVYARYLGWKCEGLEKCGIKESATLDCELEVITSGTCTPLIFKFHEPAIIGPGGEKLDCPYECCTDKQYKTRICSASYDCQENKCVEIVEEKKECLKEGEIFDKMEKPDALCCSGLTKLDMAWPDEPVGREDRCIATLSWEQICTKCGDGECGLGENWCICPGDCPKPEEVPCTTNSDCGTDSCQQGRDKCVEIKYVCQDGECSSSSQEFAGFMCQKSGCKDTCGNGICEGGYEKLHCPQDCPEEKICEDLCGDGVCQQGVCLATGCPCAETSKT
ncbi:hypothetical protein KKA69_01675, partial [Patescibacteria group bacterium]|nr:hypothetical protein [Patescibacteria group bacterium]